VSNETGKNNFIFGASHHSAMALSINIQYLLGCEHKIIMLTSQILLSVGHEVKLNSSVTSHWTGPMGMGFP